MTAASWLLDYGRYVPHLASCKCALACTEFGGLYTMLPIGQNCLNAATEMYCQLEAGIKVRVSADMNGLLHDVLRLANSYIEGRGQSTAKANDMARYHTTIAAYYSLLTVVGVAVLQNDHDMATTAKMRARLGDTPADVGETGLIRFYAARNLAMAVGSATIAAAVIANRHGFITWFNEWWKANYPDIYAAMVMGVAAADIEE